LAAVQGAGLVGGIGFQQQGVERDVCHGAAQTSRALVRDRAADADQKAQVGQLPGLLAAAGKTVYYAAQALCPAHAVDHFLDAAAGMDDDRQVELARNLELAREITSLRV